MEKEAKDYPLGAINSAPEPFGRESAAVSSLGATIDKAPSVQGHPSQKLSEPHQGEELQESMTVNKSASLSKGDVPVESPVKDDGDRGSFVPKTTSVTAKLPKGEAAGNGVGFPERGAAGDEVEAGDGYDDSNSMSGVLDVDSNETDSAVGDMTPVQVHLSSTLSLNSELYDHVSENGRTYHRYKEGKYALPNDETEQNRLDIQHQLFVHTLHGELHLAPIEEGSLSNVLDIATGTGLWAIEFASKYPSANVLGVDLSPIQPTFVPPNCRFEIDDAEDDWNYRQSFDYIHGRLLLSCFNDDFPAIIAKSYKALSPGGWFELQDALPPTCFDDSWEGTDLKRWVDLTLAGAKALGMDWHKVGKYKEWVEASGFEDVGEFKGAWPMNSWPKDKHYKLLGVWNNQNMMEGMQGISVAVLTRGLKMSLIDVELLLVGVRKDLNNRGIHCYMPVRVIYGRKPGGQKRPSETGPNKALHALDEST